MGARYDKYDGVDGGFRGKLAADLTFSATGELGPVGVSLNATGLVVVGTAAQSGFVGVLVKNVPMTPNLGSIAGQVNAGVPIGGKAGNIVDIMTAGEIADVPGLLPGTKYYAAADGSLGVVNTNPYVGVTRHLQPNGLNTLVVRCGIK